VVLLFGGMTQKLNRKTAAEFSFFPYGSYVCHGKGRYYKAGFELWNQVVTIS
jgi:undecaprenyl pyrophosphate phosphatase UppP